MFYAAYFKVVALNSIESKGVLMSPWLIFFTGLIVGWLLEWFLDYSFWRKRRICPRIEKELQNSIQRLKVDKAEMKMEMGKVGQYRARIENQDTKLTGLKSALDSRIREKARLQAELASIDELLSEMGFVADRGTADALIGLNARNESLEKASQVHDKLVRDFQSQLERRNKKIEGLEGDIETQDANTIELTKQLSHLQGQLKQRVNDVSRLQKQVDSSKRHPSSGKADLQQLQNQVSLLQSALDDRDKELDEKAAWVHDFRQRMMARDDKLFELKAQLKQCDAEISQLQGEKG